MSGAWPACRSGRFSLNDEVAVDLAWKILKATEVDLGTGCDRSAPEDALCDMVEKHGRLGRKNGKGFYDYPEKAPKKLWPGLADLQAKKLDPDTIDVEELKERLLAMQALETARCFEEGVLTDVREADVGSILGIRFCAVHRRHLVLYRHDGNEAFRRVVREAGKEIRRIVSSRIAAFDRSGQPRARPSTAASRRTGRSRPPKSPRAHSRVSGYQSSCAVTAFAGRAAGLFHQHFGDPRADLVDLPWIAREAHAHEMLAAGAESCSRREPDLRLVDQPEHELASVGFAVDREEQIERALRHREAAAAGAAQNIAGDIAALARAGDLLSARSPRPVRSRPRRRAA